MAKPEVTIATINWNGGGYVKTFFESVKLQDFPKEKMEIIMVDNGSTDGSLEFVKKNFPFVKIIEKEKNYGFAEACNIAYSASSAKFFLTSGNDTIMPKDLVSNMVSEIKGGDASIVVANDYPVGRSLDSTQPKFTVNIICGNAKVFSDDGNFAAIPRGTFIIDKSQIPEPLFDPDYFAYGEDTWLGFKLILQGKKVINSKKCKVWHDGAKTGYRLPTLSFFTERNRLLNILTFFKPITIFRMLPLLLADFLVKIFYFAITMNFRRLYNFACACGWIVFNFGSVLEKRKSIQKIRKNSDEDIISKLSCRLYAYQRKENERAFGFLDKLLKSYCKLAGLKVYEFDRR